MSSLHLPGTELELESPIDVDEPPPDNPHIDDKVALGNNYSQESNPLLSNVGIPSTGSPGIFAGITSLEAGFQLHQGITDSENQLINLVSGGAAMGLDILSMCSDPIGYVAGQLLSWMLEHVEPARMLLDQLAGNPGMIKAYAASWQSIATELADVSADYKNEVASGAQEFVGAAGEAYRARAADVQNLIAAGSSATDGIARITLAFAEVVAGVRTAVRDILCYLAGDLVSSAVMAAVVGPGTAAAIVKACNDIAEALTRAAAAVGKIAAAIVRLLPDLVVLRDLSDGIAKGLAVMIE